MFSVEWQAMCPLDVFQPGVQRNFSLGFRRLLHGSEKFALERIKVRVPSGFQPRLAIGLSLLHSSSG